MQSNTPSVLLVDDTEAQRYALRRALEQANFQVLEAANGQEALEAARHQPDLILLDVRLPDIDGFEVCRRLKANPDTSNIPVIQISAFYVHPEDKIAGLEAGADDYLPQPIAHDELVAKLKAWMRVRRAEAELRRSNQLLREQAQGLRTGELLLRDVIDGSASIIFLKDLHGRFLTINKRLEKLLGISRDELRGKTDYDIFPWERAGYYREHDRRVIETRTPIEFEEVADFPDGSRRIFLSNKFPLLDASGQPYGVCGISHDVTERKQAEQALAEKARLLELSYDAVMVRNTQNLIVYWNEGAVQVYGYTREEALGRNPHELLQTHFPEPLNRILEALHRDGNWTGELIHTRKDGRNITVSSRWSLERDANGNPSTVLETNSDITARKQAEQALAEKVRLLELSYDGVMVRDAQDRIVYWNQGAIETYGYTRAEVLGHSPQRLLQTQFPEPLDGILETLQREGRWTGELIQMRKDGQRITVSSRWSLDRDANGNPAAILEINRDITDRKRAEQALIRTEKLAGAGRMAATIAHEINNPLETITNVLYLLGTDEGLSEKSRSQLAIAEDELERVSHLTKQTLAFYHDSRQSTNVDVASVVEKVASVYKPRARVNDIAFEMDGRPGCTVWGSAGELIQVVSNLVANAMDAVQPGGKIVVKTSTIPTKAGDAVRITVADTGAGIDPAQLSRIFEPFFTTKKDVGTGLGLWITRELVSKHHGHIRVRSRKRRGTVISVLLPCAPGVNATTEPLAMAM